MTDTNPNYTNGEASFLVFEKVYRRPLPADIADPSFGLGTNAFIGQDGGDVFALLNIGYNFDGTHPWSGVLVTQAEPLRPFLYRTSMALTATIRSAGA